MKERTARKYKPKRRFYGNRYTLGIVHSELNQETTPSTQQESSNVVTSSDSLPSTRPVPNVANEPGPSTSTKSKETGPNTEDSTPNFTSASASKINNLLEEEKMEVDDDLLSGFRLMDITILNNVFRKLPCPKCFAYDLRLIEKDTKNGFASDFQLRCSSLACDYESEFSSSKKSGQKAYEVNRRMVYSMRQVGVGHAGISKFATYMNMPQTLCKTSYNKVNYLLKNAAKTVAKKTMVDATNEVRKDAPVDETVDIGVSVDASWQRRGYSSLNGVTTVISIESGKVIDTHPQTKHCQQCALKEKLRKTDSKAYEAWKSTHDCIINHVGSSGAMECEGAKTMFERSVSEYKLRYTEFYGDGDSKSHPTVENTYPGLKVKKRECIGHVQKRVGYRLRELKKRVKGLGGRGKLTKRVIDKLQNYFGIAIRSNVGNLEGMKKSVLASLFHVASSEKASYHSAYCPKGPDSWCAAQKDKANGTQLYKPGNGLPLEVIKHVKPIYKDLSEESLLSKCLHGKTQNANESFHGMIWNRLPKTCFVGRNVFEFGIYDAICHFNIGCKAAVKIFKEINIQPGQNTINGCKRINKVRISRGNFQAKESTKKLRKIKRGLKKSKQDKIDQTEESTYEPGKF